ncbi:MAG: DegT/DnrJ/EryC1/StrS family aminotransferase [Armatimonadetes bacterium]|nr:DegT/DnrJ/EryC1/StrS family aminotransferase [Armatimonadota bacterium]
MSEKPGRTEMLPFSRPHIGEEEIAEVVATLRSGWLTTGPRVEAFEKALAQYLGGDIHVVAVNSGTAALHLSVLGTGLGPGDEVITTPMTWPATANMIMAAGARPVFVDIDRTTLNLLPDRVVGAVTPRTRAILPVHFAGLCCDMAELAKIAAEHSLAVIEDAAHALGASCSEGKAGTLGLAGCFSFHPTKPITTGEGGALVTRDPALAEKARILLFHGVTRGARSRASGSGEYEVVELGFKYNMLDLQAALGIHQVARIDTLRDRRAALAARYRELLGDLDGDLVFLPPDPPPGWLHSWHIYVIKLNLERLTIDRSAFRAALRERMIATGLHYLSLHLQPFYQRELGCRPEDFPNAAWASERVVTLPLFADMAEEDVAYVAEAVREVLVANARR